MADVTEETLIEQGAIPPTDFHGSIERIREISQYDLEVPADFPQHLKRSASDLLVDEDTLKAAAAALCVGHVILQGPPGTGKSSLARALCQAFNVSVFPVTAHEDWTVFDVVGRVELRLHGDRKEEIVPVNGYFTESVIRCANATVRHFDEPQEPQAEWLLIDELNRAHIDRAFGELFTVLGTDAALPVTLPHQREGNRNLVVPGRFRIVATLNSFDRQFVNNLSHAIRRRFTFITVTIPDKRPNGTEWTPSAGSDCMANREFQTVIKRAAARVATRVTSIEPARKATEEATILQRLSGPLLPCVRSLFDLVERVRYATSEDRIPHLPIGTAQLIDTVELFMFRVLQDSVSNDDAPAIIDWAASIKLAPLFDSDVVAPEAMKELATTVASPFNRATRRELLGIVAAGEHFVE